MKIYISGRIIQSTNCKKEFKRAETFLKIHNLDVINAYEIYENISFFDKQSLIELSYKLIELCDGVYFLKGWTNCATARLEHAFAVALNKEIAYEQ